MLAGTPERMDYLRHAHAKGRYLGMQTELISVSEAKALLTNLTSGQKRWARVRGVNRLGHGPWSDPVCRMIP